MTKLYFLSDFNRFFYMMACGLITIAFMGCLGVPRPKLTYHEAIKDQAVKNQAPVEKTSYRLGKGDEIEIKFVYNPLLGSTLKVGPDGKIYPQLIGSVDAAGLTLDQLDNQLTQSYYDTLGYSTTQYTLGVGDLIEIRLLYNTELSSIMPIRPDGKILLPLVGEIKAAGRTPNELSTRITELYAKHLEPPNNPAAIVIVKEFHPPDLTVTLVSSASQKMYIGGEVAKPVMIPIDGTLRSMDALILAGGAKKTAYLETAILLRDNGTKTPQAYMLNMKKILSGEQPDAILQPYDILFIPKNDLSLLDDFMQHIYNIIPVSAVFTFPYDLRGDHDTVQITQ